MSFVVGEFESFELSVPRILDDGGLGEKVRGRDRILVKPNLIIEYRDADR